MNWRTEWQWQGPAEGSCPWLTGDEAPPSATSLQYTPSHDHTAGTRWHGHLQYCSRLAQTDKNCVSNKSLLSSHTAHVQ